MRILNRALINEEIEKRMPQGLERLAIESKISSSSLSKMRSGQMPVSERTVRKLSKALGVSEEVIAPLVATRGGEEAS